MDKKDSKMEIIKAERRCSMVYIGIIAVLAMIDLCIKKGIEDQEDCKFPRELPGSKGTIMMYKNHNPGFSFGCLKERPDLVQMVPLAAASFLSGILAWLFIRKGHILDKLAISITLGGAVSNLYDRFIRNYVVDYFSIQWKGFKKVVFNLGDFFILLGAVLMLLSEAFRTVREQ